MDQRFVRFLLISVVILVVGGLVNSWLFPPPKRVPAKLAAKPGNEAGDKPKAKQPDDKKPDDAKNPEASDDEKPEAPKTPPALEPGAGGAELPRQFLSLGSLDPNEPYRMLVTLSSRGAALMRIELNSTRYHDGSLASFEDPTKPPVENRGGYLGIVANPEGDGKGCRVAAVGPGTPADRAGVRGDTWIKHEDKWECEPGDLITAVDGASVHSAAGLNRVLREIRFGRQVTLTIERDGKDVELPAVLRRTPMRIVHEESDDPLSLLLTLNQLGDDKLKIDSEEIVAYGDQLRGVDLWTSDWDVVASDAEHVVFSRAIPGRDIVVRKTYRLARVPEGQLGDPIAKAYHLDLEIEIRNAGKEARKLAYQLDGPNGLPVLGEWYSSMVSPSSGVAGMRDVWIKLRQGGIQAIHTEQISGNKGLATPYQDDAVLYAGVNTQYFAAVLMPQEKEKDDWIYRSYPIRVGEANAGNPRLTNVSCRLVSKPVELEGGASLSHSYRLFAGPKKSELVGEYELSSLIYFGWPIFSVVAVPLVKILHGLYWLVPNYGVAIILLTVLVRGCMFPLSFKQALGAQKMQMIQPELKKIQDKHKKDPQALRRAQQELFQKHNYNPLSGCLPIFIQLPIFIGLYRALAIDVDLFQAPLLTQQIRWCSNLAAPDMLYDWSWLMPAWINSGQGMFALGPYLNVLPIITVLIYSWQQKKMMPPPTDEQQAMQQKMMQYMLIFMSVLFYKVASGLCIYFIASSLWGMAERLFLPKRSVAQTAPQTRADVKAEARAQQQREAKSSKRNGKS